MTVFNTTHPFLTGRSQAVRIPKAYRFEDDEELILNRVGDSLVITPKKALSSSFFSGAMMLDDDFMAEGRPADYPTVRAELD